MKILYTLFTLMTVTGALFTTSAEAVMPQRSELQQLLPVLHWSGANLKNQGCVIRIYEVVDFETKTVVAIKGIYEDDDYTRGFTVTKYNPGPYYFFEGTMDSKTSVPQKIVVQHRQGDYAVADITWTTTPALVTSCTRVPNAPLLKKPGSGGTGEG